MKKSFKCGFCGKKYKNGDWLKKHIAKCPLRAEIEEDEQVERGTLSKIHGELANKECRNCKSVGCWEITSVVGKIRKLRCKGCSAPAKIAV